jgi:digeranylgeranylglycerophospholipid reductase
MTAKEAFDVLVVGLGPAGAAAAAEAARAGARVLAVERNAEPGRPVQCAEFVPKMLGFDVKAVAASRVQNIATMETFVKAEPVDITPDFQGHMIDRAGFDQALVAAAQSAGAECRFSTPLRAITTDGRAVIGTGETVAARVIIGADGPRSPVGCAIGAVNSDLLETRQITVDLRRPHGGTDIFLRPEIVGGYAWLFPKGEVCNIGLGLVPSEKARLKPLLEALHAQLVAEGRVGTRVHRTTGGLIPVGGISALAGKAGRVPVLLAGDAAGLTNPVTGAGIASAVVSGRLAGQAAAALVAGRSGALADYVEEVEDLFAASLALALRRRRAVMAVYADGAAPDAQTLRDGWIAYPQYWSRAEDNATPPGAPVTAEMRETA